jgi:hypothetical protein
MPFDNIDAMPLFSAHLGKSRVDRIRYSRVMNTQRQPRARNIDNTLMDFMQRHQPHAENCPIDDIIQGIARLDHQQTTGGSKPLSVNRLYNILQCMPVINTREVMAMMVIEERQAQKYIKAIKLVMFHINRHLALTSVSAAV